MPDDDQLFLVEAGSVGGKLCLDDVLSNTLFENAKSMPNHPKQNTQCYPYDQWFRSLEREHAQHYRYDAFQHRLSEASRARLIAGTLPLRSN